MSTTILAPQVQTEVTGEAIQQQIMSMIDDVMTLLPARDQMTNEDRRGIIARYSSVLEGNFIYWMTATYMAIQSEEARPLIIDNLYEEVRDSHPVMLRKFAVAAGAFPTDKDSLLIDSDLTKVRLFLGKLQAVPSLVSMAFFEGFIQRFMPYLADLAMAQGSKEMEYTDVHGVCDIAHTQELYQAITLELAANPPSEEADLFEGARLIRALMERILQGARGQALSRDLAGHSA